MLILLHQVGAPPTKNLPPSLPDPPICAHPPPPSPDLGTPCSRLQPLVPSADTAPPAPPSPRDRHCCGGWGGNVWGDPSCRERVRTQLLPPKYLTPPTWLRGHPAPTGLMRKVPGHPSGAARFPHSPPCWELPPPSQPPPAPHSAPSLEFPPQPVLPPHSPHHPLLRAVGLEPWGWSCGAGAVGCSLPICLRGCGPKGRLYKENRKNLALSPAQPWGRGRGCPGEGPTVGRGRAQAWPVVPTLTRLQEAPAPYGFP